MRILIGDFETTPFNYQAKESYLMDSRFICFKDIQSQEKWFFNIEKDGMKPVINFLNEISGLKKPCKIYFHNLNFDMAFLYDMIRDDCNYSIIRNGSKMLQFKIFKAYKRKKKDGTIRFNNQTILDIRNSYSLFPTSLKRLGISVNLPKIEQDYEAEINQEYIEYCYRDLEIVELAMNRLISDLKRMFDYDLQLKDLPLTTPALAKKIFHFLITRKYGKEILSKIYDYFRNSYQDYMRNFYFGGRTEVFDFNACHDGHYNDINSSYPYEMFRNEFPLAPYKFYKCQDNETCWRKFKENPYYFGAICVVKENCKYPLVPYRLENGKILFPTGKKACFLFRKEIEYLTEQNAKVVFIKLVECDKYLPIFKEFVEKTYFERKKYFSESFQNLLLKLLMNSLYGKFAEKTVKETYGIINDIQQVPEKEVKDCSYREKSDGTLLIIKRTEKEHPHLKVNVFFSMMITAYARLNLTKYIQKAKRCYYTDTDSIVSQELIENSKELGGLKSEFQFKKFQALSSKEYGYKDSNDLNFKMKGFGTLNYNSITDFIVNYFEPKKQHRMVGFFEAIERDIDMKKVLVFDKYKSQVFDKRWILWDYTTKPFNLDKDNYDDLVANNTKKIIELINQYKLSNILEHQIKSNKGIQNE